MVSFITNLGVAQGRVQGDEGGRVARDVAQRPQQGPWFSPLQSASSRQIHQARRHLALNTAMHMSNAGLITRMADQSAARK